MTSTLPEVADLTELDFAAELPCEHQVHGVRDCTAPARWVLHLLGRHGCGLVGPPLSLSCDSHLQIALYGRTRCIPCGARRIEPLGSRHV